MKYSNLVVTILGCVLIWGLQSQATAQIFFTDSFDYADGDLTTVSEGLWVQHQAGDPSPPDIQVVSGNAVVTAPASWDDNRQTGDTMGANDVWYYGIRFSVELGDSSNINEDYFIHLKDGGTFNFRARLWMEIRPTDPERDFSLQISATSASGGLADLDGDFDFGEEIIAIVRWNNGDQPNLIPGEATLWVNPVDINSTSITHSADVAVDAIEALALRQDGGSSSIVTIPVVSVGTDFDAVLAEVSPGQGGGFVCATSYSVFRGMELSGSVADFCDSDDARARYNPGFVLNSQEAPVWLIFNGNAPNAIDFLVESQAGTPGLTYTVEAWNWGANSYDVIDVESESFNADSVTTSPVTAANIDTNGDVRSRVGWRKTGLTINFPWEVRVDRVGWNE